MKILRMISRLDYFEASHNEKSQTLENQSKNWILKKIVILIEKKSDREETKMKKWHQDPASLRLTKNVKREIKTKNTKKVCSNEHIYG